MLFSTRREQWQFFLTLYHLTVFNSEWFSGVYLYLYLCVWHFVGESQIYRLFTIVRRHNTWVFFSSGHRMKSAHRPKKFGRKKTKSAWCHKKCGEKMAEGKKKKKKKKNEVTKRSNFQHICKGKFLKEFIKGKVPWIFLRGEKQWKGPVAPKNLEEKRKNMPVVYKSSNFQKVIWCPEKKKKQLMWV